ncbi:DUF4176 domain-containing protein [Bacillus thuringiensis]|uniref:DUF4176 domain-containing protein n=1 Tax=Bacillus thuringiensis TaxID=1428 RepID=UPI001F0C3EAA|nr:DUF4176 domain-containing protein [Bacillus thuringiensis]
MNSHLLPIGSIVILKEGTKKLMIYGRKQQVETDKVKKFDYMGCFYPEGYISPDFTYLLVLLQSLKKANPVYKLWLSFKKF